MVPDVEHQFEKIAVSGRGILAVLASGIVRVSTLVLSKRIRVSRVNKDEIYTSNALSMLLQSYPVLDEVL